MIGHSSDPWRRISDIVEQMGNKFQFSLIALSGLDSDQHLHVVLKEKMDATVWAPRYSKWPIW